LGLIFQTNDEMGFTRIIATFDGCCGMKNWPKRCQRHFRLKPFFYWTLQIVQCWSLVVEAQKYTAGRKE
jgi:hypothetical protein